MRAITFTLQSTELKILVAIDAITGIYEINKFDSFYFVYVICVMTPSNVVSYICASQLSAQIVLCM